jgi:hypothetical protein
MLVWSIIPVFHHSNAPVFRHPIVLFPTSTQGYAGAEMRKTNPISPPGSGSRIRRSTVKTSLTVPPGGKRAKQTQFARPQAADGGNRAKQSQT